MGASAAKVASNRENAKKSSGPKTAEGKARSRANAVKHGLTGAGVALPAEDAAMVERRFTVLQEEMGPSNLAGRLLVHQMALMSVRIDRASKQEAAALATRMRHASGEFELARLKEVDRLFEAIQDCPGDHRRRLMAQPEGVDKLIGVLASAKEQLEEGWHRRWVRDDLKKIEAFFGGTFGNLPLTRTDILLTELNGEGKFLKASESAQLADRDARREYARSELIKMIEVELANLAEHRERLDLDALEQDRLEAADRALFDPDPDATHARKYEAAAVRGFSQAFRDFRQNEANPGGSTDEALDRLDPTRDDPPGTHDVGVQDEPLIVPEAEVSEHDVEEDDLPVFQNEPNSPRDRGEPESSTMTTATFRQNEPNGPSPTPPPSPVTDPVLARWLLTRERAKADPDGPRPIPSYHS